MSDWNISKKKEFVAKMGKKRASFAKGGAVKRRKYDDGGTVRALSGPNPYAVNENAANPNTGIAGTIMGALGLNNQFQASGANIQQGTNVDQLMAAYKQAQDAIGAQQNIAQTFQPGAANAMSAQDQLLAQQMAMARGEGPNPAQAALEQATAKNVANQAALMANQRGAGANVGMMARQAAQQGADTQQQAAGQSATLQAQQQIAAQQAAATTAAQQAAQAQGAAAAQNQAIQNEQNVLQGANTAYSNAAVGMQSNINNVNAQTAMANQQMAGKGIGGVMSAISGALGFSEGGAVEKDHHVKLAEMNSASLKHHYADGGPIGPSPLVVNNTQPMVPQGANYLPVQSMGGPSVEATPDMSKLHYQGEEKKEKKEKEATHPEIASITSDDPMAGGALDVEGVPGSSVGEFLNAAEGGAINPNHCHGPHKSHVANFLAKGGKVPAMVSPGEIYLNPEQVRQVIHEGQNPMKIGQRVGGKAKVKGDSLKNDTVPMDLEEGGVVIPRHITTHKMAPEKAELFVHRAMARKKVK